MSPGHNLMTRSILLSASTLTLVLLLSAFCANPASATPIPSNYWSFAKSNYDTTNGWFKDLAGSKPATPSSVPGGYNYTTGAGGAYSTGANGAANGAGTVIGPNGGGANGFRTALNTFGAGTAGSPWSYEFMFQYSSTGFRYGYQTDRGYNGPIVLTDGYSIDSNHITLSVGFVTGPGVRTTVWTGTGGPLWNPTSGVWYDVALTYDSANLKLYITPYSATATAANVGSSVTATYASTTLIADGGNLGIGASDGSRYGNYGAYDWAAVYNTALSTSDIAAHIDADSGLPAAVTTPEPSTLALLGLGAIGLLGYAGRRRRKPASV